jgi:hypothetical protein
MAWIESHQTLASHPKTRRAARELGIRPVHLIGHLHCLWHWALDHAEDGDLTRYDTEDLAIAAQWDDDPDRFVDALINCGPGGGSGFIDRTPNRMALHNWAVYTDRLVARRESSRKANHERWHAARGVRADGCEWCTDSATDPDTVPDTSDRTPNGDHPESTLPDPTQPDPTQPKNTTSDLRPAVSDETTQLAREFAEAVRANGHPIPKRDTLNANTWLSEMDRLLRIGPPGWDGDPPTVDEVRTVIRWATTDEFERANIQSIPKLRKRYSQLRLKALNTSARASPGAKGNQYADRYRQAAAELERQGR